MASLYWVGSTATWDGTAGSKWATSSGGAGGASVPTAADDVFFDASSTGTCTLSASSVCRSLNCTGFTGTISHPAAVTLTIGDATAGAGNIALKFVAGMTYTKGNVATSAINFISTSATAQSIDTGGKTLGNETFNGIGGSWILASANTIDVTAAMTLTRGTLDTNGQTCTWGSAAISNGNTRTLTLGASIINIIGSVSGIPWGASTITGLTFNAGTSTINFTQSGGATLNLGGLTYYDVTMTYPGGSGLTWNSSNTFRNLTFTAAGDFNPLSLTAGTTQTVTGTLTTTTSSNIRRIRIISTTPGSAATINAAAVSLQNTDFSDITGAGAATWTGTSLGDMLGNSNITFTAPRTLYRVGAGGNWTSTGWALTSGGATGQAAPLPQDDAFIDANASGTLSLGTGISTNSSLAKNIDFTGFAGTWNGGIGLVGIHGSLTLSSGMTLGNNISLEFKGRSSYVLNTLGKSFPASASAQILAPGGTYTLASDYTLATTGLTLAYGTLDADSYNVSLSSFTSSNANTRALYMGSGTWTISGAGTPWTVFNTTNLTLNGETSTLWFTNITAGSKTINMMNNFQYYHLKFTGGGGSIWDFGNGNVKVQDFTVLNGNTTLRFHAGANPFLIGGVVTLVGTAGNLITLESVTAANDFLISKASGTVSGDYLSIKDSTAQGGASWYAGANSTNVSGNTGWVFTVPPPASTGNMFLVF